MSTSRQQQIRILMRVFCEDWVCLTSPDEPVIEKLMTTGYLTMAPTQGGTPVPRLKVTPEGITYLAALRAKHT